MKMKTKEPVQIENLELLKEIVHLKDKKSELFSHTGPSSSDYIDVSIKLDLLVNQYVEEKIENLIRI